MSVSELTELSLADAAYKVARQRVSPLELVEAALARIDELEPTLHAFVTVLNEQARSDAKQLGDEASAGRLRGPLHGVPIAIKDVIDIAGLPTMSGSRVRTGYLPSTDAPVVSRLKAAGAVLIGKTNTHEFAMGPITPPTTNAWNAAHIPGGSSGGSATAVAADLCAAAIGTDTGGSIRIPAAFNGIVGLKPTYGRVPKSGVTAVSWSLDHVGPMTKSVADAALVLNVIAGRERADPTSAREPVPDYTSQLDAGVAGLRLGVPTNYFRQDIESDILELVDAACKHLESRGATLVQVEIEDIELAVPAALGILVPEASAFHQLELRQLTDLYGLDIRTYLELGEMHLATHYLNAQRARALVKEGMRRSFEGARLDALLIPAATMLAPRIGQTTVVYPDAGEQAIVQGVIRIAAPFSLSGQPVLTVPCGFGGDDLPVGLAVVGRPFDEVTALRIGNAFQQSTEWHQRSPSFDAQARPV